MMESHLETAISGFRAQLLADEEAARQRMVDAYNPVRTRLLAAIADLVKTIAELEPTPAQVARLKRARDLLVQVETELARFGADLVPDLKAAQDLAADLAQKQTQALSAAAATGLPIASRVLGSWNRVNTGAVEAITGRLADGSPLRTYLDELGTKTAGKVEQALIDAIARGLSPVAIAHQLAKTVDVSRVSLETTMRSQMLGAFRDAAFASAAANADLLDGWEWVASHSLRTCLACLALDGTTFPLSVTFMAAHTRCRCTPVFIPKGLPKVPRQTGTEWFDAQPENLQRSMLPMTARDAFKAGQLALEDFVELAHDPVWGDAYREAPVFLAREYARQRKKGTKAA